MLRWMERVLALVGLVVVVCVGVLVGTYETVPTHSAKLAHYDVLLVLGCPALVNGEPSPEERTRVAEGVKEFKAGRAQHMIFSGGAVENDFVEGQVMAKLAEQEGVPADAIEVEGQAQNTIQNVYYSNQIMQRKGWRSVEVVSSPSHLPRAGLILAHYGFPWTERAARWPPELSWQKRLQIYAGEIAYTFELRWQGFPATPFLPGRRAS